MTRQAQYLIALGLLILALLSLWPDHEEEVALVTLPASSVPSRENLAVEGTAPPHTEPPRASRSAVRQPVTNAPAPKARTAPQVTQPAYTGEIDGIPTLLRRIGGCESSGRPDGPLVWNAVNRSGSSASGAFQILDSTWKSWASAYGADVGAPQYSRALHAPPAVQTTVAVRAFNRQGTGPWAASRRCWA